MPYCELREYIELFLQERTPADLEVLVEHSMGCRGYGKMIGGGKHSKDSFHITQVLEGDWRQPVRETGVARNNGSVKRVTKTEGEGD